MSYEEKLETLKRIEEVAALAGLKGEIADDGRHFGEPPSVVGQLAEPRAQHRPYCRREHRLTCIGGDPGSKGFDDEERIALGLAPKSVRQVRVEGVFGS